MTQQLPDFVANEAERFGLPGVAVGVSIDGREDFACHGATSVHNPLPVDRDTMFGVGSVSKTFTATALMCLVAEERVELDAPVRRYVPEFAPTDADDITVMRLLNHTAGLEWKLGVYHQRGLLPEPERDDSGYRRYSAEDAVALVKIKTLARAGVPLARVKELLAANAEEFAAAIAEIDTMLAERAEEIRRTREQIAELSSGERLFVSTEVADYLDLLKQLGASERSMRMERDIWILLQSVAPDQASEWIADKLDAIDDPQFRAIYLDYDTAFDWPPDDPRLVDLADRSHRWLTVESAEAGRATPALDPKLVRLVSESIGITSPAWERLAQIARTQTVE